MKVIGRKVLDDLCRKHAEVRGQVGAWLTEAEEAQWHKPVDIKERYSSASLLEGDRVVFNLKGNKYRLVTKVSYKNQVVQVMKAGTHAEYNSWKL